MSSKSASIQPMLNGQWQKKKAAPKRLIPCLPSINALQPDSQQYVARGGMGDCECNEWDWETESLFNTVGKTKNNNNINRIWIGY